MKNSNLIILLVTFLFSIEIYSQSLPFKEGSYMPYEFLKLLLKDNNLAKDSQSLLRPIRSIQIKGQKIYCQTWGSEFFPTMYKILEPQKEVLLQSISFNAYEFMTIYQNYEYSISEYNNKMLLKIQKQEKTDSIIFDRFIFDSIPIKEPELVEYQVELMDSFNVYNENDEIIEANIKILPNGTILNSKLIKSLKLSGSGVRTLSRKEINGLIDVVNDSSDLEYKKTYLPMLGVIISANIRIANDKENKRCAMRFTNHEIYIYEEEISYRQSKLKRFLFKLKSLNKM